jgi:murein DD-endopeptidase MepM/ murein hydrolase activator NlpD
MGGGTEVSKTARTTLQAMMTPEDTFGLLRTLLEGIEVRLNTVRQSMERRNALAEATPSLWPAHGWLSSRVGPRRDPFTGGPDYHSGLDIAGEKDQPVYATASGTVTHVGRQGAYGQLIVIDHGFGLETRYGHLGQYKVTVGDRVKRGDVIGLVGKTGRATSYHLHYEVLANGKILNPLQLLTQRPRDGN